MEHLIVRFRPPLSVQGHVHSSSEKVIDGTRVIDNLLDLLPGERLGRLTSRQVEGIQGVQLGVVPSYPMDYIPAA
jgi:Icc-related predicted phosphoesterase